MLFNSFSYLLFLWTVFILFWTWKEKRVLRHSLVLVASYWFYGQAHWAYTSLLFLSTLTDFYAGRGIDRAHERGDTGAAKRWLGLSLAVNLGLLATFKYFDFFVGSFESVLGRMGLEASLFRLDVVLPVGISFYTFQTLSYTLDVYRRRMQHTKSLLDFAVFVSFFPQLVAGPIVRAKDFIPQLENPVPLERSRLSSGLFQILRGMAKKLIMADILGAHVVDVAFRDEATLTALGAPGVLLATYAYALQLYGDFAGYSDIAIGSARVLGFELRKNFDAPFIARSLEEFWSRWHISMSSWFTDYVYIELGGSRGKVMRTVFNVVVAWTLVGLWHGAAWTFVLWGFYHGVWLGVVRLVRLKLPGGKFPDTVFFRVAGVLFTFHVVAFSMILFRSQDFSHFVTAVQQLGNWDVAWPSIAWVGEAVVPGRAMAWQIALIMLLGYLTHFMPSRWQDRLESGWERTPGLFQGLVLAAAIVFFFALRPPGLTPFVYFQF